MKITGITVTPLHQEFATPGADCVVELLTNTGASGLATAHGWARSAILSVGRDLLMGEDPRAVTAFWQTAGKCITAHSDGALSHARAVLDIAAWDLKAKARSEPLWKTLGGAHPRANAYFTCPDPGKDRSEFAAYLDLMTGTCGFRGGRLDAGTDPEFIRLNLNLLRQALQANSHDPQLMLDLGGRWRPKDAIRLIRSLEDEFDLTWVRGVAEPGDFLGSKRVSDSIRAAVSAGESLSSLGAFLPYIHHQAANVIEIDMHYFGVSGALQLADAAYGFELPVTLTSVPGNIHAHLAPAMPYFMSMEVISAEPETAFQSEVRIEAGWGVTGNAPGTGLIVKEDALNRQEQVSVK